MDVGRDLIDHRIVDLDGHDVGRVDDVWIHVADGAAVVSPIVTGTGALLRQLGAVGDRIKRLGFWHADRWREIVWDERGTMVGSAIAWQYSITVRNASTNSMMALGLRHIRPCVRIPRCVA